MKRLSSSLAILIVSTVVWFFQPTQAGVFAAEPERISIEELKVLLDDQADVVIVDVRGGDTYDLGHIPGAVSVPSGEIRARHEELPTDKMIILY